MSPAKLRIMACQIDIDPTTSMLRADHTFDRRGFGHASAVEAASSRFCRDVKAARSRLYFIERLLLGFFRRAGRGSGRLLRRFRRSRLRELQIARRRRLGQVE